MSGLVIRGGRVWDGSGLVDADVEIAGGRIVSVAPGLRAASGDELDATGCVVLPGLVDLHVHLREPGYEEAEDIASGSAAAAAGGFCDVVVMPNTTPPIDSAEVVRSVRAAGERAGLVRLHPAGCVSRERKGEKLAELAEMHAEGVTIFTDDGSPVADAWLMRRALEYANGFGAVLADHCEDPALTDGAQMHEGEVSGRLGLRGWPASAEEIMVARDCVLAEAAGARVHIQHISTALSVEFVRMAKARGVRVSAEVTPHHLFLDDHMAESFDPVFKVNPPLRSNEHVEAARAALADGTIDAVATDHAPHTPESKEEWTCALPGMLGLETALALVWELHAEGLLGLDRLVDAMAVRPAAIAGLDERGPVVAGAAADLCVFDPDSAWTVDPNGLQSKGINTPYAGRTLQGRVRHTVLAGWPTLRDGVVAALGASGTALGGNADTGNNGNNGNDEGQR